MRALVPAETLVYLETNDLAGALQPIVDSKPFNEVAKSKPEFSALKAVQLAVAVTGLETTEEKLTDEPSADRIKPHFVAVADTHSWNFQAVGFAEQKLGSFVESIYDSEPTLEKSYKNGGRYFIWTAPDGRKAYALVIDSLIYFGNDESAIDKCLAVRRGEADSIAKTGTVQSASLEILASGYVSTDGIAQIANIIGRRVATAGADDADLRMAIMAVVPEQIRASVTEIGWTMKKADQGIEDRYFVGIPNTTVYDEVVTELGESLVESIEEASASKIAESFGVERTGADGLNKTHASENRFRDGGIERRTISDLGFFGWMIAQLAQD